MRIRTFICCIIIIVVILMIFTSAEKREMVIKEQIESTVCNYFNDRKNAYLNKEQTNYYDIENIKAECLNDYSFPIYIDNDVCFSDYVFNDGFYEIKAYEALFITWDEGDYPSIVSYIGSFHKLIINSDFEVVNESVFNPFFSCDDEEACFFSEGLVIFQREMYNRFVDMGGIIEYDNNENEVIRTTNYSPILAAEYAQEYWTEYNTEYISFSGDCANFVSQCLYAGNLPMTSSWYYYGSNDYSYSWINVNYLRPFLKTVSGATYLNNPWYGDISLGDVLFYDKYRDGCNGDSPACTCSQCQSGNCEGCTATPPCLGRKYNHTMICSGISSSDGRPLFCGHTDSICNLRVNFTPENKVYSVSKIHTSHTGTYHNYMNVTYHRRRCPLCNEYEYEQHVPYTQNGIIRCSICNAIGPFQLIME